MAQDPLTDAANTALMREAPVFPILRKEFALESAPGRHINCQLHYTSIPIPEPVHPGPPPAPPVAPAPLPAAGPGRPGPARRELVAAFNNAQIDYANALKAYPAVLQAHRDAVTAYEVAQAAAERVDVGLVQPATNAVNSPEPDFIFTHGKGSRLDNPAIMAFVQGFARNYTVLAFEDVRDMTERVSTFRSLMNSYPSATAVGGRSMGARASCRAAVYSHIKKLIFFTYPLTRGLSERYEELLALDAETDVLFIIGDSDPMAIELLLNPLRQRMRARSWWIKVIGADHAFWFDPPETRDGICNVAGQIASMWIVDGNRDPERTELTLKYDPTPGIQQVTWTGWTMPA